MVSTVAVIGNGPSLALHRFGPHIDACDVVIRINRFDTSPAWHPHAGSRTDVYATYSQPWPPLTDALIGVHTIWWVMIGRVVHVLGPRRRAWLPWCKDHGVKFHTIPSTTVERCYADLGITAQERRAEDKKPTSGVVVLAHALETWPDAVVYAAGFDGYIQGQPNYYWSRENVCEYETRKIVLDRQRAWYSRLVESGRVKEFTDA